MEGVSGVVVQGPLSFLDATGRGASTEAVPAVFCADGDVVLVGCGCHAHAYSREHGNVAARLGMLASTQAWHPGTFDAVRTHPQCIAIIPKTCEQMIGTSIDSGATAA